MKGPASGGSPIPRTSVPASGLKLGASTAPTVVAQTTSESCRPRRFGSARSTAAYRAWRLPVETPPKRNMPTKSSGTDRVTAATTTSAAPKAPIRYASTRPGRRPERLIIRVTGTASSAPPTTAALDARPERVVPATSWASSAPTLSPIVTPMLVTTCVATRVRSVRRWIAPVAGGGSVRVMSATTGPPGRCSYRLILAHGIPYGPPGFRRSADPGGFDGCAPAGSAYLVSRSATGPPPQGHGRRRHLPPAAVTATRYGRRWLAKTCCASPSPEASPASASNRKCTPR